MRVVISFRIVAGRVLLVKFPNHFPDLLTVNGDFPWGFNADTDLWACDPQHCKPDIVADEDARGNGRPRGARATGGREDPAPRAGERGRWHRPPFPARAPAEARRSLTPVGWRST